MENNKETKSATSLMAAGKNGEVKDVEAKEVKAPYPKSVIFIIGNEFCERFSYYGMKTVLTLFFVQYLRYDKDTSTMIYHVFSSLCYFTPIIGAIISDSVLGKFRTIFYISIIYVAGNVVLSLSAIPGYSFQSAITMVGLALIAFGTGGIKPCVAAFGGDQFKPGQELQLERFFSVFYMSINAGSLLSTVITPVLRNDVKCFGDDCYALAFGVPAALMLFALVLFLIGKPLYTMNAPEGNVIVKVAKCIGYALRNRSGKREHWLDHADDKYDTSFIEDIKAVLHVLVLFLPLPVFWALFDQQGSRWLLQAAQMDGIVAGSWRLKPDQVQVVNPLLIVLCIPLFQFAIYPLLKKLNIIQTPLKRMVVGGLLAAVSFVIAFFVELALEKTLPILPNQNFGQGNFLSNVPCNLTVKGGVNITALDDESFYVFKNVSALEELSLDVQPFDNCSGLIGNQFDYSIENGAIQTTMFYTKDQKLYWETVADTLKKPDKGECHIRMLYDFQSQTEIILNENDTFRLESSSNTYEIQLIPVNNSEVWNVGTTNYKLVPPDSYRVYGPNITEPLTTIDLESGGGYILQIRGNETRTLHTVVEPNSLWIVIQIPQYVVITFGEIMFSITGLEFSYSQAPASMKSVLQAGWLMTVAFGNLIVVIVAKAAFLKQSNEFIMFAGLMLADMIVFAIMAYFYKYIPTPPTKEDNIDNLSEKPKKPLESNGVNGHVNDAYDADSKTTSM